MLLPSSAEPAWKGPVERLAFHLPRNSDSVGTMGHLGGGGHVGIVVWKLYHVWNILHVGMALTSSMLDVTDVQGACWYVTNIRHFGMALSSACWHFSNFKCWE
jgi:hypothetical protein